MAMTKIEQEKLNITLLRSVMERGKQRGEVFEDEAVSPFVEKYGKIIVRNALLSLAQSGLIYMRGNSKGAVYRTTKLGQEALPRLESDLQSQLDRLKDSG